MLQAARQLADPPSTAEDLAGLREVLLRLSESISQTAVMSDECQIHLSVLIEQAGAQGAISGALHRELQRFDRVSQTLHGLAGVVVRTALQAPAEARIDVEALVAGLGLASLVRAVRGEGPDPFSEIADAHPRAGEAELF